MRQSLLCDFTLFSGVIFTTTLGNKHNYHPHLLQETEAHRDEVICPRSYSQEVVESRYPPKCSLIIMLTCLPLILRMLCFNVMYHRKLHKILLTVRADIDKPHTHTHKWWMAASFRISPLAPHLLPGCSLSQPRWDGASDCSEQARPGLDRPHGSHSRGYICLLQSFLSTRHSHLKYNGFLSRGMQGTDTSSYGHNSVGAEKEIKGITRKWSDLTPGRLMKV